MLLDEKFGAASSKVVIKKEFLKGIELSVFVLTDGKSFHIYYRRRKIISASEIMIQVLTQVEWEQSHRFLLLMSPLLFEKVKQRIIIPTVDGLKKDKLEYADLFLSD